MRTPNYAKQFDRDVKRMRKRSKDLDKLKLALALLIAEEPLEHRYFDHTLSGNYKNRRECHLESDWLLIYKLTGNDIFFERTGSHADLFK